jgi:hypothetical protein
MRIIEDKSKEIDAKKNELIEKMVNEIMTCTINCSCGVTFQIDNISDIKLAVDDLAIFSDSIYTKCPKCKSNHYLYDHLNHIDGITLLDFDNWNLAYYKLKDMKKLEKKSFLQKIKDYFNERI